MKKSDGFSMEEAKARSRHQSLMVDYLELQKEIQEKRKKLLKAEKKKHKLSAVVKFLQRKVKSFPKKQSQRIQYKLKTPHGVLSPPRNLHRGLPVKDGQEVKESPGPSTTALLDLNQISLPNDEETEYQTEQKSAATNLRKWKMEWQDHIAVRV